MKNDKKSTKKNIPEIGILLIVIVGMFVYIKNKSNVKKQTHVPVVTVETPKQEVIETPTVEESTPPSLSEDPPAANEQVKYEEVTATTQKKLDPLLVKITNFSNAINEKHEQRLREMFKGEQKEDYMEKYLDLKLERTMRMRELLKTNNSRAANLNVNYEYHNKFYALIGKDLYIKYLKILKETNDEAVKTKIVLEF